MTDTTIIAAEPATEAWHAARTWGAPLVTHLLPRSWEARRGGARPSLCGGERRRTWQPLTEFERPSAFTTCPDCVRLAPGVPAPDLTPLATTAPAPAPVAPPAQRPAAPPPVRFGPRPAGGLHRPRDTRPLSAAPVRAQPLDPQLAAAALPAGWRPRRALSLPDRDADGNRVWRRLGDVDPDYAPAAYRLRVEQHQLAELGLTFPDWAPLTTCRTDRERAGASPAPTRSITR